MDAVQLKKLAMIKAMVEEHCTDVTIKVGWHNWVLIERGQKLVGLVDDTGSDYFPSSVVGRTIAELTRLSVSPFGVGDTLKYYPSSDGVEYAVINWNSGERDKREGDKKEGWIVSYASRCWWVPDELCPE